MDKTTTKTDKQSKRAKMAFRLAGMFNRANDLGSGVNTDVGFLTLFVNSTLIWEHIEGADTPDNFPEFLDEYVGDLRHVYCYKHAKILNDIVLPVLGRMGAEIDWLKDMYRADEERRREWVRKYGGVKPLFGRFKELIEQVQPQKGEQLTSLQARMKEFEENYSWGKLDILTRKTDAEDFEKTWLPKAKPVKKGGVSRNNLIKQIKDNKSNKRDRFEDIQKQLNRIKREVKEGRTQEALKHLDKTENLFNDIQEELAGRGV